MGVAGDARGAVGPAPELRVADTRAVSMLDGVVDVHVNELHWWNNASFALPFLVAIASLTIGLLAGLAEATGFGLFMLALTALTAPVVAFTWRRTPTAIALTEEILITLHSGRELRRLRWEEISSVSAVDYDEVRWRLHHREGSHVSLENGIDRLPALIDEVCARAGLERPVHEREVQADR